MATSDADKVLRSTPGRANFQRVSRLLVCGGTSLLREIFDSIHAPSVLPTVLGDPAREKQLKTARLTKPQWDCLYPSPGVYGKSTDFDITLLSRLLRTICNLTPPPTGWDSLPASSDHSLAADLVRIKLYRNAVYGHVKESMEVRDDAFSSLWHDISETIVRIAGNISPVKRNEWKKAIDGFLKDSLTPEDERNVQELRMWYYYDMDVNKAMEQLEVTVRDGIQYIKDQLGQVQRSVDGLSAFAGSSQPLGAQLIVRIDFGTIGQQSADMVLPAQANHARAYEVPPTPTAQRQQHVAGTGSSQGENVSNQPFPSTQQILNLIAERLLKEKWPLNEFVVYMERVRKALVIKTKKGNLLITVECSSLEILEGLWEDYTSGHLNKVAQELLVTPEILAELGLTSVKLKVTILREEYDACKQYFLQSEIMNIAAGVEGIKQQIRNTCMLMKKGEEEKKDNLEMFENIKRQMEADLLAERREKKRLQEENDQMLKAAQEKDKILCDLREKYTQLLYRRLREGLFKVNQVQEDLDKELKNSKGELHDLKKRHEELREENQMLRNKCKLLEKQLYKATATSSRLPLLDRPFFSAGDWRLNYETPELDLISSPFEDMETPKREEKEYRPTSAKKRSQFSREKQAMKEDYLSPLLELTSSDEDSEKSMNTMMEEKYRIIKRELSTEDLDVLRLLPYLAKVLDQTDEDEIKAEATRVKQCEKLLEILPKKKKELVAFTSLMKAVLEVQPHLGRLLLKAIGGKKALDLMMKKDLQSWNQWKEMLEVQPRLEQLLQAIE